MTNSNDVMRALYQRLGCRRQLLVPNVSWGLVNWGECDLLALSNAGYLTEYEIKVSAADVRREWKKRRWLNPFYRRSFDNTIRRYYMAVPYKIMDVALESMPEDVGGGVIVIDYPTKSTWQGAQPSALSTVKKARTNTAARKVTDRERIQMGRLGTMRYWGEFMIRTAPWGH